MKRQTKTVCLITSSHLASNPRLVKEADAFFAAGYRVQVVGVDISPRVRALDRSILAVAPWEVRLVPYGPKAGWWARALIRRAARLLFRYTALKWPYIAALALNQLSSRLSKSALGIKADLYLAHNLAALPAAAKAAPAVLRAARRRCLGERCGISPLAHFTYFVNAAIPIR